MTKIEALKQLCKMQGEAARCLDVETVCVCDVANLAIETGEGVPDAVLEYLWERVTKPAPV